MRVHAVTLRGLRPRSTRGVLLQAPRGVFELRGRRISETGARHRVMNPMEFMARLSALAAPNPPWRVAVVPLTLVEAAGA